MRRFIVVVSLVCAVSLVGVTGGVASASPAEAHTAQASVPLVVVKTRGGATVSVINITAARALHLRTVGKPHRFCGVTGCAMARRVRVKNWNVGGVVPLPTVVVSSAPIAGLNAHPFGLLGSDVPWPIHFQEGQCLAPHFFRDTFVGANTLGDLFF